MQLRIHLREPFPTPRHTRPHYSTPNAQAPPPPPLTHMLVRARTHLLAPRDPARGPPSRTTACTQPGQQSSRGARGAGSQWQASQSPPRAAARLKGHGSRAGRLARGQAGGKAGRRTGRQTDRQPPVQPGSHCRHSSVALPPSVPRRPAGAHLVVSRLQAEALPGQVQEHRHHVVQSALVPVRVAGQPGAQVPHLLACSGGPGSARSRRVTRPHGRPTRNDVLH